LKRAFINLIDNALKYGKTARVAIAETPEAVEIVVDDDGPGIPDEELTKVFQAFYRLEGTPDQSTDGIGDGGGGGGGGGGGIGLGLAIALSIIESHGGALVLSNRPDGGLRAKATLPR
jgi:signal transduction histidine kinase